MMNKDNAINHTRNNFLTHHSHPHYQHYQNHYGNSSTDSYDDLKGRQLYPMPNGFRLPKHFHYLRHWFLSPGGEISILLFPLSLSAVSTFLSQIQLANLFHSWGLVFRVGINPDDPLVDVYAGITHIYFEGPTLAIDRAVEDVINSLNWFPSSPSLSSEVQTPPAIQTDFPGKSSVKKRASNRVNPRHHNHDSSLALKYTVPASCPPLPSKPDLSKFINKEDVLLFSDFSWSVEIPKDKAKFLTGRKLQEIEDSTQTVIKPEKIEEIFEKLTDSDVMIKKKKNKIKNDKASEMNNDAKNDNFVSFTIQGKPVPIHYAIAALSEICENKLIESKNSLTYFASSFCPSRGYPFLDGWKKLYTEMS